MQPREQKHHPHNGSTKGNTDSIESAPQEDLVKSLQHPDRLIRLMVLGELFTRGFKNTEHARNSIDAFCDFISRSSEPMERGCAGVLLCMAGAAIPAERWSDDMRSKVRAALRDDLKLNGDHLEELRFPASWSVNDRAADILLKLNMTSLVNVSVPYWVGKALQTDTHTVSNRHRIMEILQGWGETGQCGLTVLGHFKI